MTNKYQNCNQWFYGYLKNEPANNAFDEMKYHRFMPILLSPANRNLWELHLNQMLAYLKRHYQWYQLPDEKQQESIKLYHNDKTNIPTPVTNAMVLNEILHLKL